MASCVNEFMDDRFIRVQSAPYSYAVKDSDKTKITDIAYNPQIYKETWKIMEENPDRKLSEFFNRIHGYEYMILKSPKHKEISLGVRCSLDQSFRLRVSPQQYRMKNMGFFFATEDRALLLEIDHPDALNRITIFHKKSKHRVEIPRFSRYDLEVHTLDEQNYDVKVNGIHVCRLQSRAMDKDFYIPENTFGWLPVEEDSNIVNEIQRKFVLSDIGLLHPADTKTQEALSHYARTVVVYDFSAAVGISNGKPKHMYQSLHPDNLVYSVGSSFNGSEYVKTVINNNRFVGFVSRFFNKGAFGIDMKANSDYLIKENVRENQPLELNDTAYDNINFLQPAVVLSTITKDVKHKEKENSIVIDTTVTRNIVPTPTYEGDTVELHDRYQSHNLNSVTWTETYDNEKKYQLGVAHNGLGVLGVKIDRGSNLSIHSDENFNAKITMCLNSDDVFASRTWRVLFTYKQLEELRKTKVGKMTGGVYVFVSGRGKERVRTDVTFRRADETDYHKTLDISNMVEETEVEVMFTTPMIKELKRIPQVGIYSDGLYTLEIDTNYVDIKSSSVNGSSTDEAVLDTSKSVSRCVIKGIMHSTMDMAADSDSHVEIMKLFASNLNAYCEKNCIELQKSE